MHEYMSEKDICLNVKACGKHLYLLIEDSQSHQEGINKISNLSEWLTKSS